MVVFFFFFFFSSRLVLFLPSPALVIEILISSFVDRSCLSIDRSMHASIKMGGSPFLALHHSRTFGVPPPASFVSTVPMLVAYLSPLSLSLSFVPLA